MADREKKYKNAIGRSEVGSNGQKPKYFSNVGHKQVTVQEKEKKVLFLVKEKKVFILYLEGKCED